MFRYHLFVFIASFHIMTAQIKGRILSNDVDVYFLINDNALSVVNYNGKILNEIYVSDELINKIDLQFKFNPGTLSMGSHKIFKSKKNEIKIISLGGGEVYQSINDTLQRIDNSFNHKMTNYCYLYQKNDTIFKFGGYGYWSARNFITYFSDSTKEWEYYTTNGDLHPPEVFDFVGFDSEKALYVLNGREVDINLGENIEKNIEVWKFEFASKKWFNLGVSNIPDLFANKFNRIDRESFIGFSGNDFHVVNFDKNEYSSYSKINNSFGFFGPGDIIVNDTLFNFNSGVIIKTLYKDLLLKSKPNQKSSTPIYYNTEVFFSGLYSASILSLILILAIIIFLRYRKNQLPRISELGIRYKGISYYITDYEKRILLEITSNNEVSSQRMYDIVENSDLSYPQNNKIKNDTIKKLNIKLTKILGVNDFIKSKKLPEDNRVLIYYTEYANIFFK